MINMDINMHTGIPIAHSLNLITELEKLKSIQRKTTVKADNNRRENSAEHSWQVALSAYILSDFIDIEIDVNKVIQMLLIHDVVEIYAGDLFAFADSTQKAQQMQNEYNAIADLYKKFPSDKAKEIKSLWIEFEEGKTSEAKFALSVDRFLPFLQNINNQGGSWNEFNISKQQVLERNKTLAEVSSTLWQYMNEKLDKAVEKGWIASVCH